jgi:FkbH-like protein
MKLIEALEILRRQADKKGPRAKIFLATGFTPLHLPTFIEAHLCAKSSALQVEIKTGLFGDLIGNIERVDPSTIDSLVVPIEWGDLDPRLGSRSLGGWQPGDVAGVVESAGASADRLKRALADVAMRVPIVACLPTLPLPPMFVTRPIQAGAYETQLCSIAASLAESLSALRDVRIVNSQHLALTSCPASRYDIKSDLNTGFPYTLAHASILGEVLAGLVAPPLPMKGLITDLDDTLWSGIVGDDGTDGISWGLDCHSQMHGLYQQVLSSLAGAGVLIGIASKNDATTVARAFERSDLLLSKNDIFPVEANWSSKSASVGRILKTWNIGAESVIFIDDNPLEIYEMKAAYPEMECRLFPTNDYPAIWQLLSDLRDTFGKSNVNEEDALRSRSIRSANTQQERERAGENSADEYLKKADAIITFDHGETADHTRALELVNKTNQFNLNGQRLTHSEWKSLLSHPGSFLLTAGYRDKYGPLGTIAVVMGNNLGNKIIIKNWVMSCRAFSRRIEYQCLKYIFETLGANEISFNYQATTRNGPIQLFIAELLTVPPAADATLTKDTFLARTPQLFHRTEVKVHA